MTKVYNPQWGHMMDVDAPLMRRMRGQNFATMHTGGGCMAWQRPTDDEGYLLITYVDAVLGSWSDRNDPQWLVGRYNDDGDFICVNSMTLTQALRLADGLRAPVANEQTSVSALDYREG
jgi:hypothetical protein